LELIARSAFLNPLRNSRLIPEIIQLFSATEENARFQKLVCDVIINFYEKIDFISINVVLLIIRYIEIIQNLIGCKTDTLAQKNSWQNIIES